MKRTILLSVLGGCLVMGCDSSTESAEVIPTKEVTDLAPEVKIPAALWNQIEGKIVDPEISSEAPPVALEAPGVLFMPVAVILKEKTPGVLIEPHLRILFPRGGGTLDLSQYTTGEIGSFWVNFEWPDVEAPENLRVWYDSKGRRRKLDDGMWGSGCGRFFDITQGFLKQRMQGGIKVNTTRDRHLTVLGGHFIFAIEKENRQIFVTKVTFKDSQKQILFCEEL